MRRKNCLYINLALRSSVRSGPPKSSASVDTYEYTQLNILIIKVCEQIIKKS